MERLTVVDDTRKIDAIKERNFKSCTASRNLHQDNLPKTRTGLKQPKNIQNFKNIKITSQPSLKMSELKVEYQTIRPTKSIARTSDEPPKSHLSYKSRKRSVKESPIFLHSLPYHKSLSSLVAYHYHQALPKSSHQT